MSRPSKVKLLSFGGAAGALCAAAVVVRVACPGQCVACGACNTTLIPAASSALAVGAALGGSYLSKRRRR
ncbi:MAG: hypothetical protein Q7W51_03795 [Coriobacteriia bacterium]|nr:hypothetical protein [Coriobacteriia bacterium]